MEDAMHRDWEAGDTFRVNGTNGFYCRVTQAHKAGTLLIGHLTYVFG